MANGAPLPHCFVLVHEWAALLCVTLEARFVSAQECETASFEPLLNVRWRAFGRDTFVRFMAIATAHFAFENRMMMRQLERRTNFQVTLETRFRRFPWIDNRASAAAGFDMQAAWAVA